MGSVIADWVFVSIMYFTTQKTVKSQDHQPAVIVVTIFLIINIKVCLEDFLQIILQWTKKFEKGIYDSSFFSLQNRKKFFLLVDC